MTRWTGSVRGSALPIGGLPVEGLMAAWVLLAVVAGLAPGVSAQVVSGTDVPPPRIAGGDRVATTEAMAQEWIRQGGASPIVVVVPRDDTAAALATAGLAGHHTTVTLLSDSPPRPSTVEIAADLGAARAVVVGGGPELGDGWAAAGFEVTAIDPAGGAPAVAAAVGRHLYAERAPDAPRHAYLAGTAGLPDALAVGPLAYAAGEPLLLTGTGALDPHTRFLVEHDEVAAVTILGGEAVVGPAVVEALTTRGVQVDRIAGPNREATALAIADHRPDLSGILLAAGDDPADAAGAAALAHRSDVEGSTRP